MQTIKYARQRAAQQTARNIRYGFPQRGRYYCGIGVTAVISLSLSAGHEPMGGI